LHWQPAIVIVREAVKSAPDLVKIIDANGLLRAKFSATKRREQHRRKDGDDRNDNQQLDKCEATDLPVVIASFHALKPISTVDATRVPSGNQDGEGCLMREARAFGVRDAQSDSRDGETIGSVAAHVSQGIA
jgi:hypothetical protein